MGAAKNGKIIATFDWATMHYQEFGFYKDRYLSSCGLLKKPNGKRLVAVAGNNKNNNNQNKKQVLC